MKVQVIDGGARGLMIGKTLANEGHEVFMSPGGPGNEEFAHSTGIPITDTQDQVRLAKGARIGLSMATEDLPLAMGAGDAFAAAGLDFFGPTQAQARIEWDRDWAKQIGRQHNVPMGDYQAFTSKDAAIDYAQSRQWPLFLKQNGLARGKGANDCGSLDEFIEVISWLDNQGLITEENPAVVEDFVTGREASHHAFCDGLHHLSIPFLLEDHKKIGDGDTGLMTGGMGVIGPVAGHGDAVELGERFVAPIVRALGFRGLLFAGLKGGKALEWNARPGSPEFQLFLKMMKSPLMPVFLACVRGDLANLEAPEWDLDKFGVNLVLAAEGYPGEPRRGDEIDGLDEVAKLGGVDVLQGATRRRGSQLVTDGGRILDLLVVEDSQEAALERVYKAASFITFGGRPAVYRKDIGRRAA